MLTVEARSAAVAVLRMDDGKVNAIGPAFLQDFDQALGKASEGQRAVVLAGNARSFSAGLDLKVLPTLPRDELLGFMRGFVDLMGTLAAHPRPVVVAVDGPALAGGAILALCADLRLVGPRARLGLTEMPVGIPFPPPVLDLVKLGLPPQELAPAVLQGAIREGEACVASGWAHRLVPSELLEQEAVRVAEELASFNPRGYAMAKAHLRAELADSIARFGKQGSEAYLEALAAPETMAAILRYFQRVVAGKAR